MFTLPVLPVAAAPPSNTFEERGSWNGKPFFVYKHCRDSFPKMGIVVHERRPIVAVHQAVVTKDDVTFAATENFIHARFFLLRAYDLDTFSLCLFSFVLFMSFVLCLFSHCH